MREKIIKPKTTYTVDFKINLNIVDLVAFVNLLKKIMKERNIFYVIRKICKYQEKVRIRYRISRLIWPNTAERAFICYDMYSISKDELYILPIILRVDQLSYS